MAWQTPKVDWAPVNGVTDADLNRIEGNTDYLLDIAEPEGIYKQALINGNFDIWQRGYTFAPAMSGGYTADRWKVINGVDNNVQVKVVLDIPNAASQYACRVEEYSAIGGASAASYLSQFVEDFVFFAGKTVTFTGMYKVDAGTSIKALINDGAVAASANLTSTVWAPFSITKTIGSSPTKLEFSFEFIRTGLAVGKGYTVTQLQANVGTIGIPFTPPLPMDDLRKCQRYFEKSYDGGTIPRTVIDAGMYVASGVSDGSSNLFVFVPFKVTKRAIPTVTAMSSTTGQVTMWNLIKGGWAGDAYANVQSVGQNGFNIYMGTSGVYLPAIIHGHWTADAEL